MVNVVGVKDEDPDKGHQEDPVNHNGQCQELTSESHVKDAYSSKSLHLKIEQARYGDLPAFIT